ncbi:11724_t:CDS:2, partial [Racocetra persica]
IKDSIVIKDGIISGCLINSENNLEFIFELHILEIGAVRIRINEKNPLKPRYDKVKDWALVKDSSITLEYNQIHSKPEATSFSFGKEKNHSILIYHSPFRVEILIDNIPTIILNDRGFFNFEHLREKGLNDPESIGLDITFPGFGHVYGDNGAYSDPYHLYNLDVCKYEIDSPMSLYGSIPFMIAHRKGASAAVLWLNASETWIDVIKSKENKTSEIFCQYGLLTGFMALPQYFPIGYHQCRWNYLDQKDVSEVDEGFDRHDIPYDFPDPEKMQKDLMIKGRK